MLPDSNKAHKYNGDDFVDHFNIQNFSLKVNFKCLIIIHNFMSYSPLNSKHYTMSMPTLSDNVYYQ